MILLNTVKEGILNAFPDTLFLFSFYSNVVKMSGPSFVIAMVCSY